MSGVASSLYFGRLQCKGAFGRPTSLSVQKPPSAWVRSFHRCHTDPRVRLTFSSRIDPLWHSPSKNAATHQHQHGDAEQPHRVRRPMRITQLTTPFVLNCAQPSATTGIALTLMEPLSPGQGLWAGGKVNFSVAGAGWRNWQSHF